MYGYDDVNFLEQHIPFHWSLSVQTNFNANTFVVSGTAQEKPIQELLPGVIKHLGQSGITDLKKMAEGFSAKADAASADDDDVPDLVENFDEQ